MHVRLIFPHQLFEEHLRAPDATHFILIEDDLFFRQYRFHVQKLILHRASMLAFARRLQQAGHEFDYLETSPIEPSQEQLHRALKRLHATACSYYDVVDDWLQQRLTQTLGRLGIEPTVAESPSFLCSTPDLQQYFARNSAFSGRLTPITSSGSWSSETHSAFSGSTRMTVTSGS